jgi:benzoyl-CoA reductase/2-hydroxyglutaryl-CoA dehydratase subunit BcrC/BadD/HgdB
MPEVSIRPILRKVSQDYGIPIYECSFDEHTSHVGLVTRLEAFVDVLNERKRK